MRHTLLRGWGVQRFSQPEAETWESALGLLGRELGIEPGDLTIDQQIRFAQGVILAILALLPERDLPVAS